MRFCTESGRNHSSQAAADFEKAANLKPVWAELYNQAAGVYVDCPDPAYRNPEKGIALIEHAIALDLEHPTYPAVLALAYFDLTFNLGVLLGHGNDIADIPRLV
jgi:cytochrome c-type biogenesis protein CcmH/NrfG